MAKRKVFSVIFVICVLSLSAFNSASSQPAKEKIKITILTPSDNSNVGLECLVRGKVSNYTGGNVYVLVHPLKTKLWWVQRLPSVINDDGSWQTLCYLGTETKGVSEYFEIIAILTNKTLTEGQTIGTTNLSTDTIKSKVITVQRTR
jgi:hypothetical protein